VTKPECHLEEIEPNTLTYLEFGGGGEVATIDELPFTIDPRELQLLEATKYRWRWIDRRDWLVIATGRWFRVMP
jgi:hypothetical protein